MSPEIDVRDLESVRRAARRAATPDVELGEDLISPGTTSGELIARRSRRGLITVNRSPLARKIITFNLLALVILVAGVLYTNQSRDSLRFQRASGLVSEAELIADVMEASLPGPGESFDPDNVLSELDLRGGVQVFVFDAQGYLVATTDGQDTGTAAPVNGLQQNSDGTIITDALNGVWEGLAQIFPSGEEGPDRLDSEDTARSLVAAALGGTTQVETAQTPVGGTIFTVATPFGLNGNPLGVVVISSAAGEIDALVRREREQVLQMFVIGIIVSIGLSLVLASTIANPLSDLAAAAELGRDKNARKMSPSRIRIPDLTARPDEIGRLSGALRGMVSALYERIEANEQFAADVAHEIKNPLASLRSAVGTMRLATRDDQRERLLEVIDHDVRRLDRLVTDISGASRLDSELVKEEEESFDLLNTLNNLVEFLSEDAKALDVDFIADIPDQPIFIQGLEARLAQVFVNLITNAISFCQEGDAIRVWARRRENRVLVVVEDTGPGIPENALSKIFQRFYSERPVGQFGNNSGLGLAISKQIVEAHGGVIWAENIRPTAADPGSQPLGARFVVGLPV